MSSGALGVGRRRFCLGAAVVATMGVACRRREDGAGSRVLDGAGATLPFPLVTAWVTEYARLTPDVRINYQPLGSGAGLRQVRDGVVDFGATDEPAGKARSEASSDALVYVPMTLGAVVLTYNLDGVPDLVLSPELAAAIFLGEVTRWDDPRIRAQNRGVRLPDEAITVVHRAEGSGTTETLTDFLARTSPTFDARVGSGKQPRFPRGVGVRGNAGVAELVRSTPFSIGYVEHVYAHALDLRTARIQNARGVSVAPTLESMARASRSLRDELAYPMTAVSFVVVPREGTHAKKRQALARFLWWTVHEGQRLASPHGYAPLPRELVAQAEGALGQLRAGGAPLLLAGERAG